MKYAYEYLNATNIWELVDNIIRLAYGCNLNGAIFQMQDILLLDNSARMNTPSELGGNWQWRMKKGALTDEILKKIYALTKVTGRVR